MGKTNTRINKLESRIRKLETESKRNNDLHIIQLLQEINSPFSKKPRYRYSYDEISEMTGRSTGYISNLAQKYQLSRRNISSV